MACVTRIWTDQIVVLPFPSLLLLCPVIIACKVASFSVVSVIGGGGGGGRGWRLQWTDNGMEWNEVDQTESGFQK